MDIKNSISYRSDRYKNLNNLGFNVYDYASEGILNKCLPKILFKGNSILVTFLQLLDMRIILMLQYIDKLKHFKHITWYD